LKIMGGPTTAKELGLEKKHIIEALTEAHKIRRDRYTVLGDIGLTNAEAESIAKATYVID
ncbi:MAG: NAD(P)-dependent glycerol-1-phosphate dehydrogenase, partial [Candidatus Hermodarchaeota archaeon]